MYFILNVCYIPFIPLSSKSSTFFQIFRGRNGRNEFLPLSSTRPEESHFFRKKLNPGWSQSLKSKVPTTNIKVVYRAFALPYNIKLGAFVYDIRPFVPAPVQCKQCCQFGHSSYVCNSEHQVCSICSGSHFFKQCPTPNARKCPNCSLPHSANWGGCPVRKKAAQIIINSVKPVPLMSLKITPPPHVRKPFITVTSPRNPNPYWPEARPPTVTPASKPTNIAPKQPTSLRSQDSQTDISTPKQPTPVINQSSQTHDTLTPEQPTSLSNQSTQTVTTPAKKPDKDITPEIQP